MNNQSQFTIRYAEKCDASDIAEAEKNIFSDPWSENSIAAALSSQMYTVLAATLEDKELAGYGILLTSCGEAELLRIAVKQEFRHCGVGGAILKRIISQSDELECQKIFLEVRESNTAAACLYAENGFHRYSVRKNYYKNPVENAVLMYRVSGML